MESPTAGQGKRPVNDPVPPQNAMPRFTTQTDPVCGMSVFPAMAAGTADHAGATYYFCGRGCLTKFQADPSRYLDPSARPSLDAMAPEHVPGMTYTCPMHPEVVRDGPSSCPLCGMALEPVSIGLEESDDGELTDMSRRFWICVILTLPVLAVSMLPMVPGLGLRWLEHGRGVPWIELVLASPVVLWGGWPFFVRGGASLVHRALNMFTLIGLGTGVAYGTSVIAVIFPSIFPDSFRDEHGGVPLYFEPAAVITTLVLLGQVLELRARRQTGDAIRGLLNLSPKTGRRIDESGHETDIPLDRIQGGDRLRVRPGERVPVDGMVLEGKSAVDESMITGEPIAAEKMASSRVIGGTLNGQGALIMRAEKIGAETMLAQIVRMVSDARRTRAPIQRLADEVAAYFVPAVLAVALLAFMAWAFFGPAPRLAHALVAAVSCLIIACPCALGLATPMSIMVGTGRAATAGILIKNAEALENLARVDTLVFDKTGTLTEGKPRVVSVAGLAQTNASEWLPLAAAIEQGSEHPLAAAIIAEAIERGDKIPQATDVSSRTGLGIEGTVSGQRVVVGNRAFLKVLGVPEGAWAEQIDAHARLGQTVVVVMVDQNPAGLIAIADTIKPSALEAVKALKQVGLRLVMLTGDNRLAAQAVGDQLGIDEIHAEMLPEAKAGEVKRLQSKGHKVAMAGDGINDAPALAQANVGIAMGTGTDIAIESAGITLLKGDLAGVLRARNLSLATMKNIRQNLAFAFLYNALGVPIAAGALYPWTGLLLSPMLASLAMTLSSVSVIMNALRLRGGSSR